MRVVPVALACCAVLFTMTTADARAEVEKTTPELTVFPKRYTLSIDASPTVLRGSATRRGTIDGRFGEAYAPAGFNIGAGDKLWLTDPISGQVIVCDVHRTSRVGSRFVGCLEDQLPFAIYE